MNDENECISFEIKNAMNFKEYKFNKIVQVLWYIAIFQDNIFLTKKKLAQTYYH